MSTRGRRFSLVQELGSGAFGTVYLAEMESLGGFKKNVALKILNPELNSFDEASQRLRDEARLLGRLRHRHIVQVDDLVRLDGRWAVVMEHISGCDLEVLQTALHQAREQVPPLAAVQICQAVSTALDVAYTSTAGGGEPLCVVHRDIKPSNVRLTPEGEVKVLDFGIARSDCTGREAKTGRIRYGSFGYMAPERLLGEAEVPEGDVFAVGCVLFELVTGHPLGRVELGPEQQAQQVEDACQRLNDTLGESPARDELSALLVDVLAYSPKDRPSAAVVADRLRSASRMLEGEDLVAFACRFVPRVDQLIDDPIRPARGSFLEEGTDDEDIEEDQTNPTLVFEGVGPEDAPLTSSETIGFETGAPAPVAVGSAAARPRASATQRQKVVGLCMGLGVAAFLVIGVGVFALQKMEMPPSPSESVSQPESEAAAPQIAEPEVAEPEVVEPEVVEVEPDVLEPESEVTLPPAPVEAPPEPVEAILQPAPTEPTEPIEPAPDVTRLRSVKFTVAGATAVSAICGDVSGQGTTSALLRQVPAGVCAVTATVEGASLKGAVSVDKPRGVDCTAQEGALSCR